MKKANLTITLVIIAIIGVLAVTYPLWLIMHGMERFTLEVYGVVITLLVFAVGWFAYYMGKSDSRAFLKGVDVSFSKVIRSVDVTKSAKGESKPNKPKLSDDYLPKMMFDDESDGDKMVDL